MNRWVGLGWVYVCVTRNFGQNYYTSTKLLVSPVFVQKNTPAPTVIAQSFRLVFPPAF
jgi:hypothetical protein